MSPDPLRAGGVWGRDYQSSNQLNACQTLLNTMTTAAVRMQ